MFGRSHNTITLILSFVFRELLRTMFFLMSPDAANPLPSSIPASLLFINLLITRSISEGNIYYHLIMVTYGIMRVMKLPLIWFSNVFAINFDIIRNGVQGAQSDP